MLKKLGVGSALLLAVAGCNAPAAANPVAAPAAAGAAAPGASTGALNTDDEKTLYALGLVMGRNMQPFDLSEADLAHVIRGIRDQSLGKKPELELEQWGPKINLLARSRGAARSTKEKEKAKPYLEAAAKEAGATTLEQGVVFKTLTPGTGESPKATDVVKVHYEGKLIDGTVFDASRKHGTEPATFPLNRVVPCWTIGVQKMKVGEKAKLVCPSDSAYGDNGNPSIPGGATLTFEVELIGIEKMEAPPAGMPVPSQPVAPAPKPAAK